MFLFSNGCSFLTSRPKDGVDTFTTKILAEKDIDEIEMVEIAENFFVSLGFEPLSDTFWERSLFIKPQDRNVVCHASAWDLNSDIDDLRIKMCFMNRF